MLQIDRLLIVYSYYYHTIRIYRKELTIVHKVLYSKLGVLLRLLLLTVLLYTHIIKRDFTCGAGKITLYITSTNKNILFCVLYVKVRSRLVQSFPSPLSLSHALGALCVCVFFFCNKNSTHTGTTRKFIFISRTNLKVVKLITGQIFFCFSKFLTGRWGN